MADAAVEAALASPRQPAKRRSEAAHEPRTPPTLRALARRLDFSPIASPNRRPATARPYHEALTSAAGLAARKALAASWIAPLPAPAIQSIAIPKGNGQRASLKATKVLAAQLKELHPSLESCARALACAGVKDVETLQTLTEKDADIFFSLLPSLSMLQRALLKSRACRSA